MPEPQLTPVDHDPWAGLTPVDHDPFAGMDVSGLTPQESAEYGPKLRGYLPGVASRLGQILGEKAQGFADMAATPFTKPYPPSDADVNDPQRRAAIEFGTNAGYRDALGNDAIKIDNQVHVPVPGTPEDVALAHLANAHSSQSSAPWAYAARSLRLAKDVASEQKRPLFDAAEKVLGDWQEMGATPTTHGRVYQVAIKADPEHFLDWDRPLSEQHPKVQEAVKAALPTKDPHLGWMAVTPKDTGESWFRQMAARHGEVKSPTALVADPAAGASALRQAGIPGIKYLDAGSRSSGQGTRNYVVFDPAIIDIVKKYGIAGLIGMGAKHFATTPVDHDPFEAAQ